MARVGTKGLAVCMTALALTVAVIADDAVDRVNGYYADIRPADRSDLVLLPLLAKMADLPPGVTTPKQARLIPAGSRQWDAISAWAQADEQQAVIKALDRITQEENYRRAMAFGQPYGAEGVPVELIRDELYTELGDPPMLAGARHLYMPALDRAACLAHVEATRLAAEGRPADAIDLLIDWCFFARQMADREYFAEMSWGIRHMSMALERMRDIAYLDARSGSPKLTSADLIGFIHRLDEDKGYIGVERMTFPRANQVAAEQLVARTIDRNGGPNDRFASTLARLASNERPLRLFSEAASWQAVAAMHAGWKETNEMLERVFNDWASRWTIDPFDERMKQTFAYEGLNKTRFGILKIAFETPIDGVDTDMGVLFKERTILRTEAVGTRTALGLQAFALDQHNFPPRLQSIRPRYIKRIEADPFNSARTYGAEPPMEYFVPIRDEHKPSEGGVRPHTINVITEDRSNLRIDLFDDVFVLYSRGSDDAKGWAKLIQNTPDYAPGADYLIWPPLVSLHREHLIEQGRLP